MDAQVVVRVRSSKGIPCYVDISDIKLHGSTTACTYRFFYCVGLVEPLLFRMCSKPDASRRQ